MTVEPLPDTGGGDPPEYACGWCVQKHGRLEFRLNRAPAPHDGWLLPDTGPQIVLTPAPDAFEFADAIVCEMMQDAVAVPRIVARIAALRNSVFVAASPTPHGTRDEAITEISSQVANALEQGYRFVQEHPGLSTFSLSMHGGSVLSFQEVLRGRQLQAQFCYVIDTDDTLHTYCSYHR